MADIILTKEEKDAIKKKAHEQIMLEKRNDRYRVNKSLNPTAKQYKEHEKWLVKNMTNQALLIKEKEMTRGAGGTSTSNT